MAGNVEPISPPMQNQVFPVDTELEGWFASFLLWLHGLAF